MLNVAEALLVDEAKRDDIVLILRGARPTAEASLRARLAAPATDADDGDGEVEVTNIVDFAQFVANASRMQTGTPDA